MIIGYYRREKCIICLVEFWTIWLLFSPCRLFLLSISLYLILIHFVQEVNTISKRNLLDSKFYTLSIGWNCLVFKFFISIWKLFKTLFCLNFSTWTITNITFMKRIVYDSWCYHTIVLNINFFSILNHVVPYDLPARYMFPFWYTTFRVSWIIYDSYETM